MLKLPKIILFIKYLILNHLYFIISILFFYYLLKLENLLYTFKTKIKSKQKISFNNIFLQKVIIKTI
jgi:hypothetical protein